MNSSAGTKGGSAQVNASGTPASSGSQNTTQNGTLASGSVADAVDLPAGTPVTVTEGVQVSNGGSVKAVINTISDPPSLDPPTGTGSSVPGDPAIPGDPAPVPEPNTALLVGGGLILCAVLLRYSRRRA